MAKRLTPLVQYDKVLSKFGQRQLVMLNHACGFNQSETGKNNKVYTEAEHGPNDSEEDFHTEAFILRRRNLKTELFLATL